MSPLATSTCSILSAAVSVFGFTLPLMKLTPKDLDNHHPQAVLGLLAQHATLNSMPHCHFMLKQDSPAHRWYCVLEIFARRFLQQKEATDDLLAYLTAAACVARLCTTEHSHEDQPGTGPFCLQVEQRGSSVNHLPWHIQCHWEAGPMVH